MEPRVSFNSYSDDQILTGGHIFAITHITLYRQTLVTSVFDCASE